MPGQTKKVQSAHIGYKSRLWKVVTVDGVEKERTILHTDTYNPSKAIVLVGPAAPEVPPASRKSGSAVRNHTGTGSTCRDCSTAAVPEPGGRTGGSKPAVRELFRRTGAAPVLRQRVPGSSKRAHVFEQVRQQKRSDVSACTGIRCERFELI